MLARNARLRTETLLGLGSIGASLISSNSPFTRCRSGFMCELGGVMRSRYRLFYELQSLAGLSKLAMRFSPSERR